MDKGSTLTADQIQNQIDKIMGVEKKSGENKSIFNIDSSPVPSDLSPLPSDFSPVPQEPFV